MALLFYVKRQSAVVHSKSLNFTVAGAGWERFRVWDGFWGNWYWYLADRNICRYDDSSSRLRRGRRIRTSAWPAAERPCGGCGPRKTLSASPGESGHQRIPQSFPEAVSRELGGHSDGLATFRQGRSEER